MNFNLHLDITILTKKVIHNNTAVLLLVITYNDFIISTVKSLKGYYWSKTLRGWVTEFSNKKLSQLKSNTILKPLLTLDNSLALTLKNKKTAVKLLNNESNTLLIKEYTKYLEGKRYSTSTINVYSKFLKDFILYTLPKATNELNNRDLELFLEFTGNATDESTGTNNGVVNGATLTAGKDGVENTAYSFNGINNTINFLTPFLGGTQASEFSYHVRLNVSDISNAPNIWGKTLSWGEVNFSLTTNGAILFKWANNVTGNKYSSIQSDNDIISENTWYDIVVVYQNSGAEIYVNGQSVTTNLEWVAQGGSVLSTSQIEASCNFAQDDNSSMIGARITGGNLGNYFNGIIDQFCIWNRILTQQEINEIYNNTTLTTNESFESELFIAYPNPVKNYLNLKISSNHIGSKYIIYNSLGNVIISGEINSEFSLIDMNNISKGLYFLKIGNNLNTAYKIIKN